MGILTFAVLSAALTGGQEPAPAKAPTAAVASAPSDTRRFDLVYTVNNFGATIPMGCPHRILHDGGIARRLTCLRQLTAAEGKILLVDGGSTFYQDIDKAPESEHDKYLMTAELIAESYNRMGYAALGVGSSDLLLGLQELIHLKERSKFPFLCANLETPSGSPFQPSVVVEVDGVRVGVIGLLLDSIGQKYLERIAPGATVLPAIPAARKAVEALRGKVDLIVALSHVKQEVNRDLAKEVEGIDVIIDPSIEYSNHHPHIKAEEWQELVDKTIILRADGNGSALGVLEIDFRKAGAGMGSRWRLESLAAKEKAGTLEADEREELKVLRTRNLFFLRSLPLSPHYLDDPEGAALMDAYKRQEDVAKVPARPAPGAREDYLSASACKDCHAPQYKNWLENTKHARALDTLVAGGWGKKTECLPCHTTGYGPAYVDPGDAATFGGVQCESCHGTAPDHVKDPQAHRFSSIAESTCLPCHNEDVTQKNFSFGTFVQRIQCPKGK